MEPTPYRTFQSLHIAIWTTGDQAWNGCGWICICTLVKLRASRSLEAMTEQVDSFMSW